VPAGAPQSTRRQYNRLSVRFIYPCPSRWCGLNGILRFTQNDGRAGSRTRWRASGLRDCSAACRAPQFPLPPPRRPAQQPFGATDPVPAKQNVGKGWVVVSGDHWTAAALPIPLPPTWGRVGVGGWWHAIASCATHGLETRATVLSSAAGRRSRCGTAVYPQPGRRTRGCGSLHSPPPYLPHQGGGGLWDGHLAPCRHPVVRCPGTVRREDAASTARTTHAGGPLALREDKRDNSPQASVGRMPGCGWRYTPNWCR
jgi:hypothetical protein